MSDTCEQPKAVRVHVASSDVPTSTSQRKLLHVSYNTVVLTAANPYQQIVGLSKERAFWTVTAGGKDATLPTCDFTLCDKEAEAAKQAGTAESGSVISGKFIPGNVVGYTIHQQFGLEAVWIAAIGAKAADGTAFPIYVGIAEYIEV